MSVQKCMTLGKRLYQHGDEVMRRNMLDEEQLHEVLTKFLNYERPEVHDFREAIIPAWR